MHLARITERLASVASLSHRARMVVVTSLGAAALVGGFPAAALATSGVHCANNSNYGSVCLEVYGTGLHVTDIQGWYTLPANSYLTGKKWRLDLQRYNCNPIGKTKAACPVNTTWHGNTRSGNLTSSGSACTTLTVGGSNASVAYQECRNYGEVQVDAMNGYWPTFPNLPHSFGSSFWLCDEFAIYNSSTGTWHYNDAGVTNGVRACVQVYA